MRRLFSVLITLVLVFGLAGVSEAKSSTSGKFSGGSNPSISSGSNYKGSDSNTGSGGSQVYTSGQKSPSSNVTQKPSTPYQQPYQQPNQQPKSSWFGGGLGHFFGGMAAGALMGSLFSHMFHPFGGFGHGFSFFGLLIDTLLLFLAYKLIRRLFFR